VKKRLKPVISDILEVSFRVQLPFPLREEDEVQ
jgi:hypothetical protein